MRVSLVKDDTSSNLSGILVHVQVSEIDDPPHFRNSHSFRYNIPSCSGNDGEIIIYNDKISASRDLDGTSYSFALEKCRNQACKKENSGECPSIAGRANRLLVADVFHTKPTQDNLGYFGNALFKAIFSGVAGQLFKDTDPTHPNGRIFLQLNKHDDLDAIPWEYAKDCPSSFLVHQRRFARMYDSPRPQDPLPKLPLRIVAVVPDPVVPPNEPGANLPDLYLSEQFQNFTDGFTRNNKKVKLERVFPPTVSQMGALLNTKTAASTVLHFMGHCGQDEETNSRALIFEHGVTGKLEFINAPHLVSVSKNVSLAFLSACDSREVAQTLVKHGVRYTIGSNCPIPDDLARKFEFEFYKFLTNGSSVEMAMYQARTSFQVKGDIRQSNYFAGAMVLYLSIVGEDDGVFQCDEGAPDINIHEPRNNLMVLHTAPVIRGRKKELVELYSHLRNMVLKGQTRHIYTIKGIDCQEFVAEAMRRMAHLFPGGIFAWTFDKEKTSANNYFRRLVKVIFSENICAELTEQYDNDVDEFGSAIIQQFRSGNQASCLLIFDRTDILDLGRKEKNIHAEKLGSWLENIASVQDTVKILLTSKEPLDWMKGGLMYFNNSNVKGERHTSTSMKKSIHEYFEYYSTTIIHPQGFQSKNNFYNIPEENRAFVDRPVIQEMKAALTGGCKILALSGLGGMGKSQLMLRYCYLNEAAYDSIFWLTVDNWNTAVHSYRKLAGYLGLNEEILKEKDSEQKVISWILDWFQERKNWLLLLDNADNDMSENIFKLLPRKGGDIIFTTRQSISPARAKVIHIDKMQEREAIYLLYGEDPIDRGSQKFNHAREIVTELDFMPLAINLACAYIHSTQNSFKDYLRKFNDQKKNTELFSYINKNNSDEYEYSVATVWQLSLEQIQDLNPIAVQILEACAFLHPENIPACLFKQQYSALGLISNKNDSEELSDVIGKAITVLIEFSFVTRITREVNDDDKDPASDVLTIHRLVQKVIYNMMDGEQRLRLAHNIATALNKDAYFSKEDIYALSTRRIMDTYIFHIHHFLNLLGDLSQKPLISKDLSLLLVRAIWYLLQHGTYFGIDKLAQFSDRVSEAVYGEDHPQFAASLMNHASLYLHQGKYDEAEPLYKRSLAIREKSLGSEHPDTAHSLQYLAILYFTLGKYDEAEPLYKRSLAIREKSLGSEHPETAVSLQNLALLYFTLDKYDEAEPLYKWSLAITERSLGLEHPNAAASLQNLATLYNNRGKYDDAEPLYKRSLAIKEKSLGSEHPDTAASLQSLAILYFNQGKYTEAELLYKRSLAIREKSLGLEHPGTAASLQNLANLYAKWGKYDEAEPLYKRSLVIFEKSLGLEHRSTALVLNNLAELYRSQSKYDETEPLYKRSLVIFEKSLGLEHPSTALVLNNLAELYWSQGKYDEAEPLYKRSLAIYERLLGSEHPDTALTLNNLAELYRSQSKYDKAEPLYKQSLAIRENSLGSEHPDTAASLQNLANLYFNRGKYDEAEPLYKQSLAIRKKLFGSEHPDTAASLQNLANLYAKRGKYDEAEPLYKQSLVIKEKSLGSEHPDTALTLGGLATLYKDQGKYSEAELLYKRALTIFEKSLGSEHPNTALTLDGLATLYKNLGKYDEAEPLYKRALVIRENSLGSEHLDTAASLQNLSLLYDNRDKHDKPKPLYKRALAIWRSLRSLWDQSTHPPKFLRRIAAFALIIFIVVYFTKRPTAITRNNLARLCKRRELK